MTSEILVENVRAPEDDIISPTAFISRSFHSFSSGRVPTFLDSGDNETTALRTRDSAKAVDGNFEIFGEKSSSMLSL